MLKPKVVIQQKENKPIKKRLKKVGVQSGNKPIIKVGWPMTETGGLKYPDSHVLVGSVAFWHEFGTKKMPERSFFRPTLIKNNKKYKRQLARNIKLSLEGKIDLIKGMELIGMKAVADIQKAIVDLKEPELSAKTIKRKNSTNPLIDTGYMRSSATFQVIKKT